jgi:hypothetical protein
MTSTQSSLNTDDASQSVKNEHRTRFNTKFNAWFTSKKQPTIKSDKNYAEILWTQLSNERKASVSQAMTPIEIMEKGSSGLRFEIMILLYLPWSN